MRFMLFLLCKEMQMKYNFLFKGEYLTVYGYSCYNQHSVFDDLNEAYMACSDNYKCFGITDGACDMVGKFTLCMNGIKRNNIDPHTDNVKDDACIYRKQEYHGNAKIK